MSDESIIVERPKTPGALYFIGFCIGLLSIPFSLFILPVSDPELADLQSVGSTLSIAAWILIPVTLLFLLMGDHRIAGMRVYRLIITLGFTFCALSLVGHALDPDALFLPVAAVALVLFAAATLLGEMMNPLIANTANSRQHRLYLFIVTSLIASLGALVSAIGISSFISISGNLTIPLLFIGGLLAIGIYATWNSGSSGQSRTVDPESAQHFLRHSLRRKSTLTPLALLFLLPHIHGNDTLSTSAATDMSAFLFLFGGVIVELGLLLFLANWVKNEDICTESLIRKTSIAIVAISIALLFSASVSSEIAIKATQMAVGICSGVLFICALAQLGDEAAEEGERDARHNYSKYFLLAFVTTIAGGKIDGLFQTFFTWVGAPLPLADTALTVGVAGLILALNFRDKANRSST